VSDLLLELQLRILVYQHGHGNVLAALERIPKRETVEDLYHDIGTLPRAPRKRSNRSQVESAVDVAGALARGRPEVDEPLHRLAVEFENGTFLPNLRDVRRFLDRIGAPAGMALKSRRAAGPLLIRTLASLPPPELMSVVTSRASSSESDYSLLSRAIMGGPTAEGR